MAIWWRVAFALFIGLYATLTSTNANATSTGQLYWCDVRTGFAVGGYDPVAYFVDAQARPGERDFEYEWQGVTWRFVSAANRAVFVRDPEVYAPQYGGYGAERMAEGAIAEGSPLDWKIFEDRLYFFTTTQQRAKWDEGAKYRRSRADDNWPQLNRYLVRD